MAEEGQPLQPRVVLCRSAEPRCWLLSRVGRFEEGSVSEKEHKDEATATKFIEKKMAEKEKGGYTKVLDGGGGGGGSAKRKADEEGGGGEAVSPVKKTAKKAKNKK